MGKIVRAGENISKDFEKNFWIAKVKCNLRQLQKKLNMDCTSFKIFWKKSEKKIRFWRNFEKILEKDFIVNFAENVKELRIY